MAGIRSARTTFFDKKLVIDRIGKATADALMQAANTLKKIAQRSMRKVPPRSRGGKPRKVSKPGEPPKAVRTHPYLRQFLFAMWDMENDRAIIGPVKLGSENPPVPGLLERGGTVRRKNPRRKKRVVGGVGEMTTGRTTGNTTRLVHGTNLGSVNVTYAKIRSGAQAGRANLIAESLYGNEVVQARIAARPFMGPALKKTPPAMLKAIQKRAARGTKRGR